MKPLDLVIFDLDGTLVDSLPDIAWALNSTLTGVGLSPLPLPTVAQLVGDGAATLIERAVATTAVAGSGAASPTLPEYGALLAQFMSVYGARVCVDSRLYPGVNALLDSLTAAGVTMAVITNKPGPLARELLGTLGVASHFRAIVGDLDGFPRKPDPGAARSLMKACGAAPDRTVVVGDGIPDLRLARSLPCTAIAAGWGYVSPARLEAERPTHLASTPEEAAHLLLSTDAPA
ncbi:MAG: HAD hydrolase-like protein [Myxococcales bacterium]